MNAPMVRRLIKRNAAWRMTPWVMLACALFARGGRTLAVLFMLLMPMVGIPEFRSRSDVYKASLPVEGRDQWLAQIVSLLALLWLPALAALAAAYVGGGDPALFLQGASVWTTFVLAVQRYRIREFSAPAWVSIGSLAAFASLVGILTGIGALPPARMVFAISGSLSAALFLSCWLSVPRTFQITALRASASFQRSLRAPVRQVWSPVLRTVYHWKTAFWLLFILGQFAMGPTTIAFLSLPMFLVLPREPERWLASLPVARSTIFRFRAAPVVAGVCAAFIAQIFIDPTPQTPRTRMAGLAVTLMLVFLLFFLSEFPGWRRLSRVRMWIRFVPLLAWIPAVFAAQKLVALFDVTIAQLASALPANHALFALTLLLPLAFLYWLAERTFGESEQPVWRFAPQP